MASTPDAVRSQDVERLRGRRGYQALTELLQNFAEDGQRTRGPSASNPTTSLSRNGVDVLSETLSGVSMSQAEVLDQFEELKTVVAYMEVLLQGRVLRAGQEAQQSSKDRDSGIFVERSLHSSGVVPGPSPSSSGVASPANVVHSEGTHTVAYPRAQDAPIRHDFARTTHVSSPTHPQYGGASNAQTTSQGYGLVRSAGQTGWNTYATAGNAHDFVPSNTQANYPRPGVQYSQNFPLPSLAVYAGASSPSSEQRPVRYNGRPPSWPVMPTVYTDGRSGGNGSMRSLQALPPIEPQRRDEFDAVSTLYHTFKVREKPKRWFRPGRVFMILWTEPLGNDTSSAASNYTFSGAYGEKFHSKIRRFIVISQFERHSLAIPILSYGNAGVARQGPNKADHGIVHTSRDPPTPHPDEAPLRGESGMMPNAIRVVPDEPGKKLADMSRIHYGKVYTIEHNVKAEGVGMVHDASLPLLLMQNDQVLERGRTFTGRPAAAPVTTEWFEH
ncbi:hypothetical protein Slin14017_G077330 [Septoria linicola]|nr:hypothetical protein Slin14017_G077330 [Septoria linicola]